MSSLRSYLADAKARQEGDAARWAALDQDECQLCGAAGPDKRSLWLSCFYDVKEAVPEAIECKEVAELPEPMRKFFYLRTCKTCRGRFLASLRVWASECKSHRDEPKDHDGGLICDSEADIPVRQDGATVWLTRAQWYARLQSQE